MYLDFGRTADGSIKVEAQAVASLVSRHLPRGVQCSAVRLRANDGLCLVVIKDLREFWSRDDDLRRARAIAADLKCMGMDLPRLQWIRQGNSPQMSSSRFSAPVYCFPCFWAVIGGAVAAFAFLPWQRFALCLVAAFAVWFAASLFFASGIPAKLRGAFPFFKR